ncbi:MAG: (2Fe-2S)-binding protein [Candidatus Korobacteraceae bacterium]|jgi:Pyruvate/2-oxoacid:ferredoxin oxidoreductase delta subunit/bacterioferritin-associated ferredoxin
MKLISLIPAIDLDKCIGCIICSDVCPTLAISLADKKAVVKEADCRGCGACEQRCPVYCITMQRLAAPYRVSIAIDDLPYAGIAALCAKANLNPEQIICYCTATRAEEVASAILKGATSPEEISRKTGVRTGCKVECIQPVLRLLQAAGITPERPPGCQWYGLTPAVWNIPEKVKAKYDSRGFYFEEDIELFKKVVAAKPGSPASKAHWGEKPGAKPGSPASKTHRGVKPGRPASKASRTAKPKRRDR